MEALVAQLGLGPSLERWILGMALVVARIAPVVYIVPFFGGRAASPLLRIAIAVLLAALIFPGLAAPAIPNGAIWVLLCAKEALVGLAFGFLALLAFQALEMSGRLVDMLRGSNLSEALVPGIEERTSPLGDLQFQMGIVVFLLLGGHRILIRTLAASFDWIPIVQAPVLSQAALGPFVLGAGGAVGHAVATALLLAAPAVIALFSTEIALGVLGRVAPALSVHFVGMPLRAALGLVAILLALVLLVPALHPFFGRMLAALEGLIRLIGSR